MTLSTPRSSARRRTATAQSFYEKRGAYEATPISLSVRASAGDKPLSLKPNRSVEEPSNRFRGPVAGRAGSVVGFAGCDSVESSDVVNQLLVAERPRSFTPGYAWLAKRACAHPGLLPVASFAARRGETTELFLVDACVLTRDDYEVRGLQVASATFLENSFVT